MGVLGDTKQVFFAPVIGYNAKVFFIKTVIFYFEQFKPITFIGGARRADTDGSMSASGSAGPGFDPRRGSKFSFEDLQPRG